MDNLKISGDRVSVNWTKGGVIWQTFDAEGIIIKHACFASFRKFGSANNDVVAVCLFTAETLLVYPRHGPEIVVPLPESPNKVYRFSDHGLLLQMESHSLYALFDPLDYLQQIRCAEPFSMEIIHFDPATNLLFCATGGGLQNSAWIIKRGSHENELSLDCLWKQSNL